MVAKDLQLVQSTLAPMQLSWLIDRALNTKVSLPFYNPPNKAAAILFASAIAPACYFSIISKCRNKAKTLH